MARPLGRGSHLWISPKTAFWSRSISLTIWLPLDEIADETQVWVKNDAFIGEVCVEALLHAHAAVSTKDARCTLDNLVTLFFEIVCSSLIQYMLEKRIGGDRGESAWQRKLISAMKIAAPQTGLAVTQSYIGQRNPGARLPAFAIQRHLLPLHVLMHLYMGEAPDILKGRSCPPRHTRFMAFFSFFFLSFDVFCSRK